MLYYYNKNEDNFVNLRGAVDLDYDIVYDCKKNKCSKNTCYCPLLENIKVKINNYTAFDIVKSLWTNSSIYDLEFILYYNWLKRKITPNSFKVDTYKGYYGEEIGGIYLDFFALGINYFEYLSNKEKIEFILNEEYKYLLPEITKVKEWQVKKVNISEIEDNTEKELDINYIESFKIDRFSHSIPHEKEIYLDIYNYINAFNPICLNNNGKYRVIDGRHRFYVLKNYNFIYKSKKIKLEYCNIICPKD